jgi:hypothetical protein
MLWTSCLATMKRWHEASAGKQALGSAKQGT